MLREKLYYVSVSRLINPLVEDRQLRSIDQNRAFNIAASLLFMMDFGIMHGGGNNCDRNTPLIPWRDRLSAKLFLAEAFPEARDSAEVRNAAVDLTASQLKKHGKLQLKATNDIRSHLVLDHEERTVWIFHHTTMLRESLKCGEGDEEACMLLRKLILEVLDTLHLVLSRRIPLRTNYLINWFEGTDSTAVYLLTHQHLIGLLWTLKARTRISEVVCSPCTTRCKALDLTVGCKNDSEGSATRTC
jgi:uncharacterized membrane protein